MIELGQEQNQRKVHQRIFASMITHRRKIGQNVGRRSLYLGKKHQFKATSLREALSSFRRGSPRCDRFRDRCSTLLCSMFFQFFLWIISSACITSLFCSDMYLSIIRPLVYSDFSSCDVFSIFLK